MMKAQCARFLGLIGSLLALALLAVPTLATPLVINSAKVVVGTPPFNATPGGPNPNGPNGFGSLTYVTFCNMGNADLNGPACDVFVWNLGAGVTLNVNGAGVGDTLILAQTGAASNGSGGNFDTSERGNLGLVCGSTTTTVTVQAPCSVQIYINDALAANDTSGDNNPLTFGNDENLNPPSAELIEAHIWVTAPGLTGVPAGANPSYSLQVGYADNVHKDLCATDSLGFPGTMGGPNNSCFPQAVWCDSNMGIQPVVNCPSAATPAATFFIGDGFPALGACPMANGNQDSTGHNTVGCWDSGALLITALAVPNVTIIKFTNGADANDPNAAGVPNIAPGGTVTWTYRVTNTGQTTVPSANVVVTDNTTGVTPVFSMVISGASPNFFAPGDVWLFTATGTALNLTLPPPSGVHTVANSCTAGGTQPPSTAYTNIGTVTIPGATASDPSSYCNPPPGGYTLTKNPKNATYNIGDNISFTMVVTATGPGTANNVVLNDPLPTLGNLNAWTFTPTGNPGGVCTISANVLNCPFGNLASGQTRTVVVTTNAGGGANATACTNPPQKLNNTATLTGAGLPTLTDTGDYTCTPGSYTLTKNPKNATYNIGDNINFTMVVTSTGPGTANNVVLNDPLPTLGNLNTWTITANPGGCSIVSNTLNCQFGNLANGATRTVTVATTAVGGANATACTNPPQKLNNTATLTGSGLPTLTDTGDYTCTPGGYTLTKNPKNATYNIGQNINFTMVVTSTGPGTANNVVLNDPLPTLGNLNAWTFAVNGNPGGVCTISANVLNCPFGNLANGQTRTVTVTTNAVGGANATACTNPPQKLNNTATLTGANLPTLTDTGDWTCTPPGGKPISIGPSSMEGAIKISNGDWVNGGYSLKTNFTGPITVSGTVTISGPCSKGAASDTVTVPLPPMLINAVAGADWLPTGDANSVLSWQGAVLLGGTPVNPPAGAVGAPAICGGVGVLNASHGAVFNATISGVPTGGHVTFRFKYRDPFAKGKPNTDCLDTSDPNRARADVCGASWSETKTDP
jgi:uncharacterized repeat protein (TIGR01451 family)